MIFRPVLRSLYASLYAYGQISYAAFFVSSSSCG